MAITNTLTAETEILLSERVVTTDYRISNVFENIKGRSVRVEIELGPFIPDPDPILDANGNPKNKTFAQGGKRIIDVWTGNEYDAIRDTWTNVELIAAVKAIMG